MKKIIVLLAAFFASIAFAFGQPDYESMRQALKIYKPKMDSIGLAYKNFCETSQVNVQNFNPAQKQYLTKKYLAFSRKADALLYEIEGDEKHAKRYFEWAEKELSDAESYRKRENISLTSQEDEYITLFCEVFFYYNIVETLSLNLEEKNLL